jgi:hypothetical protein
MGDVRSTWRSSRRVEVVDGEKELEDSGRRRYEATSEKRARRVEEDKKELLAV